MEALYFGNAKGGLNHGGAGKGPWIMADMENALWGANVVKSNEEPINHRFVTVGAAPPPLATIPDPAPPLATIRGEAQARSLSLPTLSRSSPRTPHCPAGCREPTRT